MTANMFENPENDWLATASSRARARFQVNIKKLSADERAQFRTAQSKEMDKSISNDVISVCQRAGIAKERVMTMRWVHTWKVAEDTRETRAKARLVVHGFTDPDMTENSQRVSYTQSPCETAHSTHRCFARFSLEKGRCEDSFSVC